MAFMVPIYAAMENNRRSEAEAQHIAAYDPVKAGFDSFSAQPRPSRLELAAKLFSVAANGEELPSDLIDCYSGDVAIAAVSTATSTGLTHVTPALLFRSLTAHYRHEARERIYKETDPLRSALYKEALPMKYKFRRQLQDLVLKQNVGGPGLVLCEYARPYGFSFGFNAVEETANVVTAQDMPSVEIVTLGPDEEGTTPSLHTAALAGLQNLEPRVKKELEMMRSAIGAIRTMIPDFVLGPVTT
jgi:hypothetical protein